MNRNLSGLQFSSVRDSFSTSHYAYLPGDEDYAGAVHVNHPSADEPAELSSIRVRDQYQGRGLGSALLEHALAQHGDRPMTLEASPFGNEAMSKSQLQSFYARHGFQPNRRGGGMTRKP